MWVNGAGVLSWDRDPALTARAPMAWKPPSFFGNITFRFSGASGVTALLSDFTGLLVHRSEAVAQLLFSLGRFKTQIMK